MALTSGTAARPDGAGAALEAAVLCPVTVLDLERHSPAARCGLEASHHLRLLQRVNEDACGQERARRQILARTAPPRRRPMAAPLRAGRFKCTRAGQHAGRTQILTSLEEGREDEIPLFPSIGYVFAWLRSSLVRRAMLAVGSAPTTTDLHLHPPG